MIIQFSHFEIFRFDTTISQKIFLKNTNEVIWQCLLILFVKFENLTDQYIPVHF